MAVALRQHISYMHYDCVHLLHARAIANNYVIGSSEITQFRAPVLSVHGYKGHRCNLRSQGESLGTRG